MSSTLLQRARIVHADVTNDIETVDVRLTEGRIDAVGSLTASPQDRVVDLDGYILLPAAVEPHAHLDKSFLAERIANPSGDLMGAIRAMDANRHLITVDDIVERAERAARLMARNGYTAVRTHADTTNENGLTSVEALAIVRDRLRGVIDIQIVALSGWPVSGSNGADQRTLVREAVSAGADLVGGCPHLEEAGTAAATDALLEMATDLGVGVDLHTDETLDPTVDGLSDLCRAVIHGFDFPVTASHCVSLGQRNQHDQDVIAELVASAGVSVVALPHTNLFLQGRDHTPMPRGLTAIAALRSAGVNVAAGADNLQDPFNPLGRACPFETAGLMILSAHLLPSEAWESVSANGRVALGLEPVSVSVGSPANLVAVRAHGLRDAIAWSPVDRLVWGSGRLHGETES